jgi:(1->4)-alpha-D-glucan 1-alpha-D-glucosylmutase
LRATAPGVVDTYQGTELWDLSLVDPDNRRPVDYERRAVLLGELASLDPRVAMARADEGVPKLLALARALHVRRSVIDGAYEPLATDGADSDRVIAFARGDHLVTVAPRFSRRGPLVDVAVDLPPGRWFNAYTFAAIDGGRRRVTDVLGAFPVALLHR